MDEKEFPQKIKSLIDDMKVMREENKNLKEKLKKETANANS